MSRPSSATCRTPSEPASNCQSRWHPGLAVRAARSRLYLPLGANVWHSEIWLNQDIVFGALYIFALHGENMEGKYKHVSVLQVQRLLSYTGEASQRWDSRSQLPTTWQYWLLSFGFIIYLFLLVKSVHVFLHGIWAAVAPSSTPIAMRESSVRLSFCCYNAPR